MTPSALAPAPHGTELLDDFAACPETVATSLGNIGRSNRWFGGWAAVRFGLDRLIGPPTGRTYTLLDVGTGLGDLPRLATRWAERRGDRLVPIGLERHPIAARLAHQGGLPTVVGCASAPPVRDRGVDIVLVSQVAHHLAPASVVTLLQRCNRAARVGVIIADLRRSWVAAAGFRIGARLLGFDPVTRADGITSIQRGYTADELRALTAEAGIEAEVHRRPGARLVALWRVPA